MGEPAERGTRATYADLEAVPSHQVAELIRGALHVFPRPAPRHARTSSRLGMKLGPPFDLGDGGPGGWLILDEPELHLADRNGLVDVLVPDIAGWRRERMPELPETAFFGLAPDWICEVLSPSTERVDRRDKLPLYGEAGVPHVWLCDPIARELEVHTLGPRGAYGKPAVHQGDVRVRLAPFDALELDLAALWA